MNNAYITTTLGGQHPKEKIMLGYIFQRGILLFIYSTMGSVQGARSPPECHTNRPYSSSLSKQPESSSTKEFAEAPDEKGGNIGKFISKMGKLGGSK